MPYKSHFIMAKNNKNKEEGVISKSFSQWTIEDIKDIFNLTMKHEGEDMPELLQNACEITEAEKNELNYRRKRLIDNASVWNEIELEVFFLVPVLDLLKMDMVDIVCFVEKPFGATVDNYHLSGEMDWIIASGYGKPKSPFFCIKEFKKAKSSSNDPEGQLAAGMLAAQALNEAYYAKNPPVYGAYIMGREWIFAKLQGRNFTQSLPFLLTDEAMLMNMFRCLKQLKNMILVQKSKLIEKVEMKNEK